MLEIINDDDPAAMREYAPSHFSPQFLKQTSVDELIDFFLSVKVESGGLDVAAVLKPEMEGEVNLLLRTREGKHFIRMVAFETAQKITDFFFCSERVLSSAAMPFRHSVSERSSILSGRCIRSMTLRRPVRTLSSFDLF